MRDKSLPLSANVLIDLSNDIATILGNTGDEGFCIKNGKIYTKDQTRRGIWIRGQIMDSVSKI